MTDDHEVSAADTGRPVWCVRRLSAPHGLRRRKNYEVQRTSTSSPSLVETWTTHDPVTLLRDDLGMADAHSMQHEVDRLWESGSDDWATLWPGDR